MPNASTFPLLIDAVRRPSPFAREIGRPILVFTGDMSSADEAVDDVRKVGRWAPHALIDASAAPDVVGIVERLASRDGLLTRWVGGTLLPPPRFLLTRFILWAWREAHPATGDERQPTREDYVRSYAAWRRTETYTGPALRSWADYVSRTMTTWLPASGLTTFGLQHFMDGVSLVLWLVSPAVAIAIALLHATLLLKGMLDYRWFRKAPYGRRAAEDGLIEYAMRIGGRAEHGQEPDYRETAERLLVAALLEDLRQAYRRRLFPWSWPGWGRHTYPVVGIKHADPGTAGRRFIELVAEVRVDKGQRGPLLLAVSTPEPPAPHHPEFDAARGDAPAGLYQRWGRAMRLFQPSPYLVIDTRAADTGHADARTRPRRTRGLRPLRAMVFWAFILVLIIAPVTVTAVTTLGCGAGLREMAGQCVGLGSLDKIGPHEIVLPVAKKIEQQNAEIPFGSKVLKIVYFGPLTARPDARFKKVHMEEVAGELAGLGAHQAVFNSSRTDWQIKVLFANTGQDFVGARRTAIEIARQARNDPSLAAVIGFSWSREEVKQAVIELTKADIPMISTMGTADQVAMTFKGKRSPYFYRLAVVDSRQVKVTVHWLERIGLDPEIGKRPKVAVVWQDEKGELYSRDLADLFMREYHGEKTRHAFDDDASLAAAIEEACRTGAKVIYYTGRADYLGTLRTERGASCRRQGVRLLASDDVTGAIAGQVHGNTGEHTVSMSYVALTDARASSHAQNPVHSWTGTDETLRNFSYVHAAFGYDAAYAVTSALGKYRNQNPRTLAIRSGVHYNLRGLSFHGKTGAVVFPDDAIDHDAQGRSLWLMTVEAGKEIRAVGQCRPTIASVDCAPPTDRAEPVRSAPRS